MAKPGRNDPCHCGSGNKYKKCCLAKDEAAERDSLVEAQARRDDSAAAHPLPSRQVDGRGRGVLQDGRGGRRL